MSNLVKNRTEILFLYHIENANPNGDPLNENRPRYDVDNRTCLVSDVRLKRTIRDYLFEYKGYNGNDGKDIFVRETFYHDNNNNKEYIKDAKRRSQDFNANKKNILNSCIDIRLFGGVIPLENDSITFTGPVQFQMGRSLHKVEIITEQGTGAFASSDKKTQKTFRTEYKLPYALIGFNGIINEKAAQYTGMTENDKDLLFESIWEGTLNLISRSKFGQQPLFLMFINYKEPFYISNLRQKIKLVSELDDTQIRSINDYKLDFAEIINILKQYKDKIENFKIYKNEKLNIVNNGNDFDITQLDINNSDIKEI